MTERLEPTHVIDRALLREDDYFMSLLEQARARALLGEDDIERLQMECLALLAYKSEEILDIEKVQRDKLKYRKAK